jgi:hypothetical protein
MKLLRIVTLALLVTTPALLMGSACPRPLPDPGTVIVSCTMDAVHDAKIIQAILDAAAQPNFMAALASLVSPALGITAEVIACVLHSYMAKASASPDRAHPEIYQNARSYLKAHGYEVP